MKEFLTTLAAFCTLLVGIVGLLFLIMARPTLDRYGSAPSDVDRAQVECAARGGVNGVHSWSSPIWSEVRVVASCQDGAAIRWEYERVE